MTYLSRENPLDLLGLAPDLTIPPTEMRSAVEALIADWALRLADAGEASFEEVFGAPSTEELYWPLTSSVSTSSLAAPSTHNIFDIIQRAEYPEFANRPKPTEYYPGQYASTDIDLAELANVAGRTDIAAVEAAVLGSSWIDRMEEKGWGLITTMDFNTEEPHKVDMRVLARDEASLEWLHDRIGETEERDTFTDADGVEFQTLGRSHTVLFGGNLALTTLSYEDTPVNTDDA